MTPFEEQLKQYFPDLWTLYILMQDMNKGGGGETKLRLLIDALLKYNQTFATGSILIDYSKGKISHIDTRIRITANSSLS